MHSPLTESTPTPAQPRAKHQRTETLRPFVQKYQYQQLPLPEPGSLPDEEPSTLDAPSEPAKPKDGK